MWISEGVLAGLMAGVFMGMANEIGHRLGLFSSNLVRVDGSFALRSLNRAENEAAVYVLGTVVHLLTSVVFGTVYVILAGLFGFEARLAMAIIVYVFVLWISMLLIALPVAGQGIMGQKIGKAVWAEQLILHTVFGLGFWWALGLI
ncbi:MAG: hypothetical protein AVO38_04990 [delta proteobacterium ML8_D]|jgi:hypothetical protein|nr:MAG: hypothetical protein AVO38_04990 [delta proteobacterium ML8_D]